MARAGKPRRSWRERLKASRYYLHERMLQVRVPCRSVSASGFQVAEQRLRADRRASRARPPLLLTSASGKPVDLGEHHHVAGAVSLAT
jgi:hypothetical protein